MALIERWICNDDLMEGDLWKYQPEDNYWFNYSDKDPELRFVYLVVAKQGFDREMVDAPIQEYRTDFKLGGLSDV